jgi:hypothetical protein
MSNRRLATGTPAPPLTIAERRAKGVGFEINVCQQLLKAGLTAEHVGATHDHDIVVPLLGKNHRVEVKVRGDSFRRLYGWLAKADFLIMRADGEQPLLAAPLSFLLEVIQYARAYRKQHNILRVRYRKLQQKVQRHRIICCTSTEPVKTKSRHTAHQQQIFVLCCLELTKPPSLIAANDNEPPKSFALEETW